MKPKPILLTAPMKRAIRAKLLRGFRPGDVAASVGISRRLLWRWIKLYSTFGDAFERGRRCPVCHAIIGAQHGAPTKPRRDRPTRVTVARVAEPLRPARCA